MYKKSKLWLSTLPPFVCRNALGIDEFCFEVFQIGVVQVKLALERPIRHPPLALKPRAYLFHNLRKLHLTICSL